MNSLEPFGHGGDLRTAQEQLGIPQVKLLDFSANINPLGPPASVLQVLKDGAASIVHYPDPAQRAFRQALHERLQLPVEWILAGNGAAECMALAILALAPKAVGVVYPCFSEYETLARQFGAQIVACHASVENQYKPVKSELYRVLQKTDLVFIGTPNNPTGTIYSMDELIEIAEWTEETQTYVVFDEAFLDFVEVNQRASLIGRLERYPWVIIIRSLTKMFAIPGLRLGYAVAHPTLIERMRNKQVTWSVNALALRVGEVCLQESEYEEQTRQLIRVEREFLRNHLESDFDMKVCKSEANYLLVHSSSTLPARTLQRQLGQKGILIRNCDQYPGLSAQAFRIAVRTREENIRLLTAIHEIREEGRETI